MKKIILLLVTTILFLGIGGFCLAQDPTGPISFPNPLQADSFIELLDNVFSFLQYIGIALAVIMIIWTGISFMTAGGDPEKIKRAKTLLIYVLIGLGIILIGRGIIFVIQDILSP